MFKFTLPLYAKPFCKSSSRYVIVKCILPLKQAFVFNFRRRNHHHHHQPNHKKRCRHRCHHCHHHFGHSQLTTSAPFGNNVLGGRTHARSKSCSTTELDTIIPMLQSHADGGSSEGKTTSEDDEGSNAAGNKVLSSD